MEPVTVLAALMIAVGIAGLVVPLLPGLALSLAGVLIWAIDNGSRTAWIFFGICAVVAALGWIIQYVVPGRRMRAAGVPTRTLLAGAVLGIIGFFVIPVVGLFVGFILGVFIVELGRLRDQRQAWTATKSAIRGVLMSIGIELAAAVLLAIIWVIGLFVTR